MRILLAILVIALTGPVLADPCDDLRGKKLKTYNRLGKEAAEHYKADDFVSAVEAILQLKAICDEDPRLDFNLARAYQKAGNCNMARFWYESVLEHEGSDELSDEQPEIALEALAQLETQCAGSTRVTVACSDRDVSIVLKGASRVESACPFSGRVDAGRYTLTAAAEGLTPSTIRVDIAPEVHNRLSVPPLIPEETGYSRLSVPCTAHSGDAFELVAPDGNTTQHTCPAELRLPHGDYTVRFPGAYQSAVTLRPDEAQTLQADEVLINAGFGREGWGYLSLGIGVTLLATSIGLHVLADSMLSDVLEPDRVADDGTVLSLSQRQAQDIEGRAQTVNSVAIVGDILGGLAIATGVALLVWPSESDEDGLSLSPVLTPGGGFFSLSGRF